MLNELLLLSGNDIPFIEAGVTIHQPTLKEIAYIGEDNFYSGCGILNFSKDNLKEEDRISLNNKTNFEILMSMIMDNRHPELRKNKIYVEMLLGLIFPSYLIKIYPHAIYLQNEGEINSINSENFEKFKEILTTIFCLKGRGESQDYNPGGELAKKIADKLRQRHQKLAEFQSEQKMAILSRYVSILAVGEQKNINDLMNYTVYQLFDEFDRFELKEQFDLYIRAQLAGARDLKEVDNWKKDIHP